MLIDKLLLSLSNLRMSPYVSIWLKTDICSVCLLRWLVFFFYIFVTFDRHADLQLLNKKIIIEESLSSRPCISAFILRFFSFRLVCSQPELQPWYESVTAAEAVISAYLSPRWMQLSADNDSKQIIVFVSAQPCRKSEAMSARQQEQASSGRYDRSSARCVATRSIFEAQNIWEWPRCKRATCYSGATALLFSLF